jgi:hypothetical protein
MSLINKSTEAWGFIQEFLVKEKFLEKESRGMS